MVEVYFKNGTSAKFNCYDAYECWRKAWGATATDNIDHEKVIEDTPKPTSKYIVGDVLLISNGITDEPFVAIVEEVIFSKRGVRYKITNAPNYVDNGKGYLIVYLDNEYETDSNGEPLFNIIGKVGNTEKVEYADNE